MFVAIHIDQLDAIGRAVAQRPRREPQVSAIPAYVEQIRFRPMTADAQNHVEAAVAIHISDGDGGGGAVTAQGDETGDVYFLDRGSLESRHRGRGDNKQGKQYSHPECWHGLLGESV